MPGQMGQCHVVEKEEKFTRGPYAAGALKENAWCYAGGMGGDSLQFASSSHFVFALFFFKKILFRWSWKKLYIKDGLMINISFDDISSSFYEIKK